MEKVSNPFQACNDIFFKPANVFHTLKDVGNWSWFAFIIIVLMTVLPSYMYMNFVDFEWFREMIISAQADDMSPAEQDMMRNSMTLDAMIWMQIIGTIFGMLIWNAVVAVFFNVATKSDEENMQGFTDWYGFSWWIQLPLVINSLIFMLLLALATEHQTTLQSLMVTSLAFVLDLDMTSPWFNLGTSVNLFTFWSLYLAKVGISTWVNVSNTKAWTLAVIPTGALWIFMGIMASIA